MEKTSKQNALRDYMEQYGYAERAGAQTTEQWTETRELGSALYLADGSDAPEELRQGKQYVVLTINTLEMNSVDFAQSNIIAECEEVVEIEEEIEVEEMVPEATAQVSAPESAAVAETDKADEEPQQPAEPDYSVLPPEADIEYIPNEGVTIYWVPDNNGNYNGEKFRIQGVGYPNFPKPKQYLLDKGLAKIKEVSVTKDDLIPEDDLDDLNDLMDEEKATPPDYTVLPPEASFEWVYPEGKDYWYEWIPNEAGMYVENEGNVRVRMHSEVGLKKKKDAEGNLVVIYELTVTLLMMADKGLARKLDDATLLQRRLEYDGLELVGDADTVVSINRGNADKPYHVEMKGSAPEEFDRKEMIDWGVAKAKAADAAPANAEPAADAATDAALAPAEAAPAAVTTIKTKRIVKRQETRTVEKTLACRVVTPKGLRDAGVISARLFEGDKLADDVVFVVLDNGHDVREYAYVIRPYDLQHFVFDGRARQFFSVESAGGVAQPSINN